MWQEETSCPAKKTESRECVLKKLRNSAFGLPKNVIQKMIQDLKPRCQRLYDANGRDFEDGVKKAKQAKKVKRRRR